MSATMIRGCRKIVPRFLPKYSVRHATTDKAYYVLIPEIPTDTPESNPVMRLDGCLPYSEITPDAIISGCAKRAIECETELGNIFEHLEDPSSLRTFETVLDPIESVLVPMECAWRTAKHFNYVKGTEGYRYAFQRIRERVDKARNERWLSEHLYNAVKEINADKRHLTDSQQALINKYLLEGRLNGLELYGADKKKFMALIRKLATSKSDFRERVMLCHGMFSHTCGNYEVLKDLPKPVLNAMSRNPMNRSKGPWKITLHQDIYGPVMEACHDRNVRWNVWQAHNNRASINFDSTNLSNHKLIGDILLWRKDVANLLGYDNFAQMSMETKMAGSIESVMNMIEFYKSSFKPKAQEDIAELDHFAKSLGYRHDIALWDVAYFRKLHRDEVFNFREEDLSVFFPLSKVLEGLFSLCNRLFGITIKENTQGIDVWHPTVKRYEVYDGDTMVSSFYLDPFLRPEEKISGAWMEVGREKSTVVTTEPFSYMNLNLPRPSPMGDSMLSMQDVETVFHEFGHGLQQMLTKVEYSEIAGQKNVEWDALHICASFMKMWLTVPDVLQSVSRHQDTGEIMSADLAQSVIASRKHMVSYNVMKHLYLSAYDMELHVSNSHWNNTMEKLWPEYMPLEHDEEDNHPCSLTYIFSDQYPAAYYSTLWSEMIAADAFGAFREVGVNDAEKVSQLGRRFKDTFLSLGGSVPAGEVFRQFRGRDPLPDGLVDLYTK